MKEVTNIEDRKERDEEFVREYVDNGGNATQAAIAVGVSQTSAKTVGHRLKTRLSREIDEEQKLQLEGYAPKAIKQIQGLAENAESENVKLKANADLLDRAGWKPVERSEVTEVTDLQNMTTEELQAELDAFYKADAKKLVDS